MPNRPETPYEIMIDDDIWASIAALPRESQRDNCLKFLWSHASHTPTLRIPGKLKRLRGEHSDLFQYEIDQEYRLLYTVDEERKRVHVQYVGYHPDWSKRSSGGRRIRR